VRVPTGAFVARRNGHVFVTGNSSFPKATRIDKALDKRAGAEREAIRKGKPHVSGEGKGNSWESGYRLDYDITAPATPLARAWAGHRYGGQVLKDMSLPVVVAQKPWTTPRLDCIVETGSGAMNVEAARVATGDNLQRPFGTPSEHIGQLKNLKPGELNPQSAGRWPPNCAFTHFSRVLEDGTIWGCVPVTEPAPCPDCSGTGGSDGNGGACGRCGGSGVVEVGAVERVKGSGKPGGIRNTALGLMDDDAWEPKPTVMSGYAEDDGREPVTRYRCARHCASCGGWWRSETATACPECGDEGEWACAVRRLGSDGGYSVSKRTNRGELVDNRCGHYCSADGKRIPGSDYERGYNDAGSVARFFPNPDFAHETAERLALGQTRKYAAKPAPREKSAGLERFVWRKRKSGHTRIWSDAAVDQFWHWQQERKGLPGEGFDKWLQACGESKRKVHKIPYTWGNTHATVKSLTLDIWLSSLLLPPDLYAPRRLLCPFGGSGTEALAGAMAGFEHVTVIEQDPDYCDLIEGRRRFWTGWSAATGETEVKPILKAAKRAQREPGQTPQPPVAVEPVAEQLQMEAIT